jgi:hypothetical protein
MSKEFFTRTVPILVTTGLVAAGCSPAESPSPEMNASTPPPAVENPAPEMPPEQCFYGYNVIGTLVLSQTASRQMLTEGTVPDDLSQLKPPGKPQPKLFRYVIDEKAAKISDGQAPNLVEASLEIQQDLHIPISPDKRVAVVRDSDVKDDLTAQGRTEGYIDVPEGQLGLQTGIPAEEPTCLPYVPPVIQPNSSNVSV